MRYLCTTCGKIIEENENICTHRNTTKFIKYQPAKKKLQSILHFIVPTIMFMLVPYALVNQGAIHATIIGIVAFLNFIAYLLNRDKNVEASYLTIILNFIALIIFIYAIILVLFF